MCNTLTILGHELFEEISIQFKNFFFVNKQFVMLICIESPGVVTSRCLGFSSHTNPQLLLVVR